MGNFDFREFLWFWRFSILAKWHCHISNLPPYRRRVERVPKTAPKGVVFCRVFTGTETYTGYSEDSLRVSYNLCVTPVVGASARELFCLQPAVSNRISQDAIPYVSAALGRNDCDNPLA
jgi:hypothetical protein